MPLPRSGLFDDQERVEDNIDAAISSGALSRQAASEKRAVHYLSTMRRKGEMDNEELAEYTSNLRGGKSVLGLADSIYGKNSPANKAAFSTADEEERTLFQEFGNQMAAGVYDIKSLFSGLAAWAGDITGNEDLENASIKEYMILKRKMQNKYSPTVGTVEEAWDAAKSGDVGDVGQYIIGTFGRQTPQLTTMILGGGLLGMIGKATAKGIITDKVAKKLLRGTVDKIAAQKVAEYAGRAIVPAAFGVGEVSGGQIDLKGEVTDPGAAGLFGIAIAALDAALPVSVLSSFGIPKGAKGEAAMHIIKRIGLKGLTGSAMEGGTEAAQEALALMAEKYVAPEQVELFSQESGSRILNSLAAGALVGGVTTGGIEGIRGSQPLSTQDIAHEEAPLSYTKPKEKIKATTMGQAIFDKMAPLLGMEQALEGVSPTKLTPHAAHALARSAGPVNTVINENAVMWEDDPNTGESSVVRNDGVLGLKPIVDLYGGVRESIRGMARRPVAIHEMDEAKTHLNLMQLNFERNALNSLKKHNVEMLAERKTRGKIRELLKSATTSEVKKIELRQELQNMKESKAQRRNTAGIVELRKQEDSLMRDLNKRLESVKSGRIKQMGPTIRELRNIYDRLSKVNSQLLAADTAAGVSSLQRALKEGQIKEEATSISEIITELQQPMTKRMVKKLQKESSLADVKIGKINKKMATLNKKVKTGQFAVSKAQFEELSQMAANAKDNTRADAELTKLLTSLRDFAAKGDIVDPEFAKEWNQDIYVPLYRDMSEAIPDIPGPSSNEGQRKIFEKRKGSEKGLINPLDNITQLINVLVPSAIKNQADIETVKAAQQIDELNLREQFPGDQGEKLVTTTTTPPKSKSDWLFLYDKGKKVYYRFSDPHLYSAMAPINKTKLDGMLGDILTAPVKLLRFGITRSPDFGMANFIRDATATWMVTPELSPIPFLDSTIGLWKAFKNSTEMKELATSGSKFDLTAAGGEVNYMNSVQIDQNTYNPFKKFWGFYKRLGDAAENAARVQLYSRLRQKGLSKKAAAARAKGLVDFSQHGSAPALQYATRLIPFLNARLQGWNATKRNIRRNPKSFAFRAGLTGLATAGLYFLNRSDNPEEWEKLSDNEKRTYWHMWFPTLEGEKQHFRIPKPFELGYVFGTGIEVALDNAVGDEPNRYVLRQVQSSIAETIGFEYLPQAIKPATEVLTNFNTFTGRPIVPEYMEKLRNEVQIGANTSPTAVAVGQATGLSPLQVEHVVKGYFGTLYYYATSVTNAIAEGAIDIPERRESRRNIPLLGPMMARFLPENNQERNKFIDRFYELNQEVNEVIGTMNYYRKEGNFEEAQDLMERDEEVFNSSGMVRLYYKLLQNINRRINAVLRSDMSGAEKDKMIDELSEQRGKIAEDFVKSYAPQAYGGP